MAYNNTETVEQIVARIAAEKAAARAELERTAASANQGWKEEQAAKAKARADAQQAAQEKQQAEAAERFDREHKHVALSAWKRTGGTEQEFEQAWPKLREELRLDAVRSTQARARAATAATMRSVF